MVVLPAFALPMTRIRKWGHLYCSLSTGTYPTSVSAREKSPHMYILTYLIHVHQQPLPLSMLLQYSLPVVGWGKSDNEVGGWPTV